MCLNLLDKPRIQKRKRPVICFKVLNNKGDKFVSPYRDTRYRRGEVKAVNSFTGLDWCYKHRRFKDSFPLGGIKSILRGLHAFQTIGAARKNLDGNIIVQCHIPPGTPFVRGTQNEIVALSLEVGDAVGGKVSLRKMFNGK